MPNLKLKEPAAGQMRGCFYRGENTEQQLLQRNWESSQHLCETASQLTNCGFSWIWVPDEKLWINNKQKWFVATAKPDFVQRGVCELLDIALYQETMEGLNPIFGNEICAYHAATCWMNGVPYEHHVPQHTRVILYLLVP